MSLFKIKIEANESECKVIPWEENPGVETIS